MSKILVSNNEKWVDMLRTDFNKYFEEAIAYCEDSCRVIAYKKLNMQSQNYYRNGNDYILCTGTLIYKKHFGLEALKLLLNDANKLDVKGLRANCLGSYSIAIKIKSKIYVFVDETHTYFLYFYIKNNDFIITNTYWHIAKVTEAEINDLAMLEKGVRRCIMSNNTPFKDIYKLSAHDCLTYDINTRNIKLEKVLLNNYSIDFKNKDEAINALYASIIEISSIRSKYIKKYHHFLTGGIDSRLELAINLYNHDNISLGYWKGKDLLTNGTNEDAEIVEKIAKKYNLKYDCYDVTEDYMATIESLDKDKCKKYGELASLYSGNSKLFSIFEELNDVECVGFGYLGETMRELKELDHSYHNAYSLDEFISEIYCRTGLEKNMFKLNGFYEYLKKEMTQLINLNMDDEFHISKDMAFKLFSYSRFEADCSMNNFANLFVYSIPIFGQKKIADLIFSFKYDWLKGDYIPIKFIELMQKDILYFPIYSHHREYKYLPKKSIMSKTFKYKFLDKSKILFKNTPVYTEIYLKFAYKYIRPQTKMNSEILLECKKIIEKLSILDDSDIKLTNDHLWNSIDIGTVATFIADLKVFNYLKGEK